MNELKSNDINLMEYDIFKQDKFMNARKIEAINGKPGQILKQFAMLSEEI